MPEIRPFMTNYKEKLTTTFISACQCNNISGSESGQILVIVIITIQTEINSESESFEIELRLSFPTDHHDLCFLPPVMNNQICVKFELKQST